MLQFGHNAPGSASTQPASLGPCFGNILKGKRLRRNGGSHKWSTAAHHLFGHEKEVTDACAEQLLGLLISRVVALGCSPSYVLHEDSRVGQHLQRNNLSVPARSSTSRYTQHLGHSAR